MAKRMGRYEVQYTDIYLQPGTGWLNPKTGQFHFCNVLYLSRFFPFYLEQHAFQLESILNPG